MTGVLTIALPITMAIHSSACAALTICPGDGAGCAGGGWVAVRIANAAAARSRWVIAPVCHAQSACESPAERLGRAFQCELATHPIHALCHARNDRVQRSGGRVVEGARLESEYTAKPYRGFESLPLRHGPLRSEEHTSALQS